MTTLCPVCNKSVDPLRSRFVGVQGGKVVAYCSAACSAQAQHAATSAAVPGGAPPPIDVPARLAPPPAGVPARALTPATALDGPPRSITPGPGVPITIDSGPVIQILYEPSSGVVTGAPDERAERTEPRAKHPDEIPIAAFWSADKEKSGAVRMAADPGSGPVKLPPGRDDPPGAATSAVAARSRTDRALSEDPIDDDVAPPRRSRASLVALLVLLLGAAGFFAYQYLMKHNVAAATKLLPAPEPPAAQASLASLRPPVVEAAPAAEPPPPVDVAAAVEQARATLRAGLAVTSQRLQRIAAAALARTQDAAACEVLAAQLGLAAPRDAQPHPAAADGAVASAPVRIPETSDIAKLDLAYSLARGGDKRGSDALAAGLASQRADVRDEAARLLALLGDTRAVPHLTDVLTVSQRRLGAAEHLAHLVEPHAIKVLEALRGDARTSVDDKARATIALGIAGHPDVAPALRDMLGDPHFNAFAAAALAELKDAAARPVLEQQLASPALRVRAARALRRLDPALDPTPILPPLLDVLRTGRDTDQVQVAEVILLLAGPVRWSAFE